MKNLNPLPNSEAKEGSTGLGRTFEISRQKANDKPTETFIFSPDRIHFLHQQVV